MSNQLQKTTKKIMVFAAAVVFITLASCTKKTTSSDAAKFIGTWNGTTTCAGGSGSGTMTFGGSGNTLTNSGFVGSGACYKAITANGTASGNTYTFPAQTYTDNCGVTYTVSSSGSLSGSTLTAVSSASSAAGSVTCTFVGTK